MLIIVNKENGLASFNAKPVCEYCLIEMKNFCYKLQRSNIIICAVTILKNMASG